MYTLPPAISSQEFADFRARVLKVRAKIEQLGYGTQAAIAYDTRMNASRVSNTLRCKAVDLECLERIEVWVSVQPIPAQSAELQAAAV